MKHRLKRSASAGALWLILSLTLSSLCLAMPAQGHAAGHSIRSHDLFVQIDPERHALTAVDRMTIHPEPGQPIRLSLSRTLRLDRLVWSSSASLPDEPGRAVPFETDGGTAAGSTQYITLAPTVADTGDITLTAYYHGVINDPPKEPRHLRFVTPSETAGHIGADGVYLSSESQWYLDLPESLSRYRLRVALPAAWTAVTQGKRRTSEPCPPELCTETSFMLAQWEMVQPGEALTLVANRFVVTTRDWSSRGGQLVQLAAYLFPEDAHLADEYLDATARYLDAYIPLLGSYPFETFAVVENFFASGLGMPSFTLLGSGVIKRHYVQPYALGHEIVHSWIGNAVFNRVDRGNWVEGLTTYLANYYWHEISGDQEQAREQRKLMLQGYNLHVPPDRDYPLGQFTRKQDERDNAIGYQKAAMVFHVLRQELGEESFWRSLRQLVARYQGRHADWSDVERVFEDTAAKDLRWFFRQWVEGSGAPSLTLTGVTAVPGTGDADGTFTLEGRIVQTGTVFRSPVPLHLRLSNEREHRFVIQVTGEDDSFSVRLPSRPLTIVMDPDAMILRRVPRRNLPPVLNHYVTDVRRSVVAAFKEPGAGSHPFEDIIKRIEMQEARKAVSERTTIVPLSSDTLLPQEGSMLVLGTPVSRRMLDTLVKTHCGTRVQLHEAAVTVGGTTYEGPGIAALASCHRQDRPGSVVTWLYAVTPQAATTVARLLFFYGWNSFVVFQEGKAITRGEWEAGEHAMEVRLDESMSVR
jgi:aminopeptidase N